MVTRPRLLLIAASSYAPALGECLGGLGARLVRGNETDIRADAAGLYKPAFDALVERAYTELGGLDAVVFCDRPRHSREGLPDPEEIVAETAVVTKQLLALVRSVAPRMIKEGISGQFILICDVAAVAGRVGLSPTSSAGGALIGMGKSIAKELGRYGLAVNIICHGLLDSISPGMVYTEAEATLLNAAGLGKRGNLGHLANNIVHLAGSAHWMNGQILHVSDGLVA